MNRNLFIKVLLFGFLLFAIGWVYLMLPADSSVDIESIVEVEDVPHSFTIGATGLIKSENSVKRKSFSRLNKYDVKEVIFPTFECNDVKLQENLSLILDDMIIPLSAYDPELRIGYIWLDYNVIGESIMDKRYSDYMTQQRAEQQFLNQVEKGVELFFENEEGFLVDVFGIAPESDEEMLSEEWTNNESSDDTMFISEENWKQFNDAMMKSNSIESMKLLKKFSGTTIRSSHDQPRWTLNLTKRKWDFFHEANSKPELLHEFGQEIKERVSELKVQSDRKEYLEIIFVELKKMIFLDKLNQKAEKNIIDDWTLSAAEVIEDPIRFFGFAERIKYLRDSYATNPRIAAMEAEVLKITQIKNKRKWWEHSEALINLLQANGTAVIKNKNEYDLLLADIIENHPYTEWKEHYYKITDLGNKFTISLEELNALPSLASTQGIFIAPFSIYDDRTIYDMQEEQHQQKLKEWRTKIKNAKSKSERKQYKEELMKLSNYRSQNYAEIRTKAKELPKQKIKEDLEIFIEWAKQKAAEWKNKNRA